MVTTEGLLEAYYDCRRNKRSTASAVMYELDYEGKLIALKDRVNARTYQPGKSICFVVTRPRYREVFAASFEDRIIHHWVALRLEPLFEQVFSPRTFNCRKGKGQLYGIQTLKADIAECSQNYTRDCWIMKLDLQGFFMSIDKQLLYELLDKFILERYDELDDIEDLRYLCKTVILHCPEKNCERHSPARYWDYIPTNKSLFTNGEGKGIAIGNLFSQLFANFLLNILDWFLLKDCGFKYVGRYVDDFYVIDTDKQKLLNAVPRIREKLATIGLTLHPRKFYIQHYTKGVEFTGSVVKRDRVYTCNRNLKNFVMAVRRLNAAQTVPEMEHCVSSINSYLGLLRHNNEYRKRREILCQIERSRYQWVYIKGPYEVLAEKKRYKLRTLTLKRIRDGDY